MNTLKLINEGAAKLRYNNIISSKLDSEILLSRVLKKEKAHIWQEFLQKNSS